eukprot:1156964-Pelagomonas_calceolata.AAC.1
MYQSLMHCPSHIPQDDKHGNEDDDLLPNPSVGVDLQVQSALQVCYLSRDTKPSRSSIQETLASGQGDDEGQVLLGADAT